MAQTHTLTGKVSDLVGGPALRGSYDGSLRGVLELSASEATATDTGETRLGSIPIMFAGDGSWSVAGVPATGDEDYVPLVQAIRVRVGYTDPGTGRTDEYVSNWFELTGDAAFKDLVEADLVQLQTARAAAESAAASAAAAAAIAVDSEAGFGSVEASSISPGSSATATIIGEPPSRVLMLGIPAGAPGVAGPAGPAGADSTVPGPTGPAGPGVPAGGATGQLLSKVDATNYNTTWVDPPSGGGGGAVLLTSAQLTNNPATTITTTSTTPVDVNAGLAVTFTMPASGEVMIVMEALAYSSSAGFYYNWSLREGTTNLAGSERVAAASTVMIARRHEVRVTGTPGASRTIKWAHRVSGGITGTIAYGGTDFTGTNYGAARMEVYG